MKISTFCIVPLPTEIAEEARHVAESGAGDHAVIKVDSPTGIRAGTVCVGHNLASVSFCFPTLRFLRVIRILRPDRFSFMLSRANVTARRGNIRQTFARAAPFALTMQITT
jgi:hypothetical protein